MNKINERLQQMAEYYGLKRYADFARKTGLSHQTASNYLKGKQKPDIEKLILIKQAFENINANWLLTGKGEMLGDDKDKKLENIKDLRELLASKDKIIALQEEKIRRLEQGEAKFVEAIRKALEPYFKTVLRNQNIIAGGLGKIILDFDDVANDDTRENNGSN